MLFNPLDEVLGSVPKVQVLRALLRLSTPVSGREAQKLARVRSRRSASNALGDLSDLGVLHRTEMRGSHLYEVNREHHLVDKLASLFVEEDRRLPELVGAVREKLSTPDLEHSIRSLILYGSNARWGATPRSDVDILAVVDSDAAVGEAKEALYDAGDDLARTQGLRISPYVMSAQRVKERAADGDPFIAEVRNEGRVLMGESLDGVVSS